MDGGELWLIACWDDVTQQKLLQYANEGCTSQGYRMFKWHIPHFDLHFLLYHHIRVCLKCSSNDYLVDHIIKSLHFLNFFSKETKVHLRLIPRCWVDPKSFIDKNCMQRNVKEKINTVCVQSSSYIWGVVFFWQAHTRCRHHRVSFSGLLCATASVVSASLFSRNAFHDIAVHIKSHFIHFNRLFLQVHNRSSCQLPYTSGTSYVVLAFPNALLLLYLQQKS